MTKPLDYEIPLSLSDYKPDFYTDQKWEEICQFAMEFYEWSETELAGWLYRGYLTVIVDKYLKEIPPK